MRRLALLGALVMNWMSFGYGGEIEFVEDFVLAKDRAAVLKQLVPGTEDYSYYHALYYLQNEQYDKIDALMAGWVQRHGETQKVSEIRTRLALATYDKNPQKSLEFLRNRLGLTFSHQKEQLDAQPNLPTLLDQALITREAFLKRAYAISSENTEQIDDRGLDWLINQDLSPNVRRSLLSRLTRPDSDKLVKLVIDDLNQEGSGGFGSLGIHRQLTIAQLEELVKSKPELLNLQNLVTAYLIKLQPTADEDWRNDHKRLEAYLDRLWKLASRLAPAHNSLKSHVLYHRLLLDRIRGEYNKERFVEYLKLPRPVGYLSKKMMASEAYKRFPSDLNANYGGATVLMPIGNDEPLVRSYLTKFLVDAANPKEFEPYINDIYLQHLFAEVKIVNGLGDADQWASQLPPAQFQALKERVDLDFAYTNKSKFALNEPVKLDLFVKNAGTLIVKVFEINTQNYYREQLREVDTDINLDGLVANIEQTHSLPEPPLRRIAKSFEFPQLDKPGVYIIDFIGNGQSSRTLIRKGSLKHLVRTIPLGHQFTILNEKNEQVKDATIWMAGHEYTHGSDGTILVPFGESNGRQPIIISQGGIVSLSHFEHESEDYELTAGFYVDRESLLKRKTAQLIVRPTLSIGGTPVSLKLLEDVKLTIVSTDIDEISSSHVVSDFRLYEDRESVQEIQVPRNLSRLKFTLTAKVKVLSQGGEKIDLEAKSPTIARDNSEFAINQIDETDDIDCLHLVKANESYVLELRGKTGEVKPARPVQVSIDHKDFRNDLTIELKTDESGRIQLGRLMDIQSVRVAISDNAGQQWTIGSDSHTYPEAIHGKRDEPIAIPFFPQNGRAIDAGLSRDDLSLFEIRNDLCVSDRFQNVTVKDGLIVLTKLPAGDFELLIKPSATRIKIRITDGPTIAGFVAGEFRQLELPKLAPVQIESLRPTDAGVTIKLRNPSKFSRVHLFATKFVPDFDLFNNLVNSPEFSPRGFQRAPANSVYITGRNIGDEYRYIIDRKYATKYPGNSLDRPSVLLNPWAIRDTETGEQQIQGGGKFGAAGTAAEDSEMSKSSKMRGRASNMGGGGPVMSSSFANLDFLAVPSAALLNLVPDENGEIKVTNDAIGPHQHLHVVVVDPVNMTYRNFSLPERKTFVSDLRLTTGLDPQKHFTQQKQISIVPAGQTFTLNDIATSKFEMYDSLARVYGLYRTLNPDLKLAEFAFVLNWPKLKLEEKRSLYSKYASHELSFFLFKKDPEFFNSVVKPYLANKRDKTLIDRFLLEENLSEYLTPWRYGQLNVVERILLARKIADERGKTARHIGDLYALLPPNTDNFIRLFDTAVKAGELEGGHLEGLSDHLEQLHDHEGVAAGGMGGGAAPVPAAAPMNEGRLYSEDDKKSAKEAESKQRAAGRGMGTLRKAAPQSKDRSDESEKLGRALSNELFFDSYEATNWGLVRQLYRKMEKTKEWAENNYHHLTIDQQGPALITVNRFWKDFAEHDPGTVFLSRNLAEASRSFPEMMFALAVLDLPFESPTHETKFDGAKMTLIPGGPLVVFHEEVKTAGETDAANKVLVSQNFFRNGDRTRIEDGEQVDKFVTDEFLVNVVYGCQIVVTNPTSSRQKLNVLLQIPVGAIPVLKSQATKTVHLTLEPYNTKTVEYHFYFPTAGKVSHFPVQVAKNETLIASAAPVAMNVVDKPTRIDTGSWDYVSQSASTEDMLAFLDQHNLDALNLDRIAWRMRDTKVFTAVIARLASRHIYNHTLWSYSIKHNLPVIAREFLQHADQIVNDCGGRLRTNLLTIDPVVRRTYEHLEYKPLVNARAHSLSKRRQIVNDRFHAQYHRTLKQLSYERTLNDDDLLTMTYYLLLQDRIEESLATFARVNVDRISTKMQYDYCAAYLDFFTDDHSKARSIAAKYVDHPVDRWRQTFAAISAQLDEAEGKEVKRINDEDRNQQQTQLAATEPNFDVTIEGRQIQIDYQNLKSVRVNFYEMDVELLFSRNPFVQQFRGQFSSIKPNLSLQVALEDSAEKSDTESKKRSAKSVPLPESLLNKNVLVEVVGAGQKRMIPHYSNALAVQVIENYGQIKVAHQTTGKPVSKAYVKVYAQMSDGRIKFYKDGYTDVRGRFEFASLNTNDLDVAGKFSVLILSDEYGALVREAAPPKK